MASFVPDPDLPLADLVEMLAADLAGVYQGVEAQLVELVRKRAEKLAALAKRLPDEDAGRGLTVAEARRRHQLMLEFQAQRGIATRELRQAAEKLVQDVRDQDLANRIVQVAAAQGEAAAAAMLGFTSPSKGLLATSSQAAAMVAISLHNRLEDLNQRITRYPQDAYQRIVAMYTPGSLLGVTTSRERQAQIVQRFLAEGVPAFVDKSGRTWTVGAYAEMAGRTTAARAYNDASIHRMQQSGLNLVSIEGGLDACKRCAPWIGVVLSTDGTPAGSYSIPRMDGPGEVTVTVKGTVDDARAAGWGHPNCRDRVVAYLPGVSELDPVEYDEEAEQERAKQRAIERRIRDAKRREAAAMTPEDRRKAAADVREAQADMRDFIRDTGRNRNSAREQLHFADGKAVHARTKPATPDPKAIRTDRVTSKPLTKVPPHERIPQTKPDGLNIDDHEWATGERLSEVGFRVEWRKLVHGDRITNPDVTIDGDTENPWEFKSPQGSGPSNISNQMRNAKGQGARRLVVDMARSPLDEDESYAEIRRRFAADPWWEHAMFIRKDGSVTLLTKH